MKLLYLISHGHTARGAVQTGLINKLVDSGHEVLVLSKTDSDQAFRRIVEEQGATLYAHRPKASKLQYHLAQIRTYVHQRISENPALYEKHLRKLDRQLTRGNNLWRNRLYALFGNSIRILTPLKIPFRWLENIAYSNAIAEDTLKKHNPDLVISTRPVDPMEIELLIAAKNLQIHRVMYILSWDNITSKGFFPVLADDYLTWGPIMNNELKDYYQVSDDHLYSTGVTHFDIHAGIRDGQLKPPGGILASMGLSEDRPFLFFTMSASYYAPNEIDIIEYLSAQVEEDIYGTDMQLVIRPHMVNLMADRSDLGWLERLKNLNSKRVKVDFPDAEDSLLTWYMKQEDMLRLSFLLNRASVCLNSGSTIAVEAVYLDRPVVLTPFDTENWPYWQSARRLKEYIHLQKFISTGACIVSENLNDMYKAIEYYLESPDHHRAERQRVVELECYRNDGKSTERFVENINMILNAQSI